MYERLRSHRKKGNKFLGVFKPEDFSIGSKITTFCYLIFFCIFRRAPYLELKKGRKEIHFVSLLEIKHAQNLGTIQKRIANSNVWRTDEYFFWCKKRTLKKSGEHTSKIHQTVFEEKNPVAQWRGVGLNFQYHFNCISLAEI